MEALPSQLVLKELSPHLRAALFAVVHAALWRGADSYDQQLVFPWNTVLRRHFVVRQAKMVDEFPLGVPTNVKWIKQLFSYGNYAEVLGFLQWVIRQEETLLDFETDVASVLEFNRAAYRLVDYTIIPIASEEAAGIIRKAVADVSHTEFAGARQHMRKAAELLSGGDWAGGTREAINAVESVARVITGESTFGAALRVIENRWKIQPALRDGFNKIYGYTNGEQGIRHPLLDEATAAVGESEAMFMYGACSSLITYLTSKDRKIGRR